MATILVIDDSSEDRQAIRDILETRDYDIVESETLSPTADGLESADVLVLDPCILRNVEEDVIRQVRAKRPRLPVVVVSTAGNEDLVIRALQRGAVSYVPKRLLPDELLPTLRDVLERAREHKSKDQLLQRRTHLTCQFEIENEREYLGAVVSHLQKLCVEFGLFTCENELTRVGMALDEALANSMLHGNLEVSSALRDEEGCRYEETAKDRSANPKFADRRIHVTASFSHEGVEFTIRDDGPGFDATTLGDPTNRRNLERVSGRGILLMRTFMDEVRFNSKGNCVTLIKKK